MEKNKAPEREELLREGRTEEQSTSPFKDGNVSNERTAEEEADAEQQLKEASTERD